jgi:hypothetical protein
MKQRMTLQSYPSVSHKSHLEGYTKSNNMRIVLIKLQKSKMVGYWTGKVHGRTVQYVLDKWTVPNLNTYCLHLNKLRCPKLYCTKICFPIFQLSYCPKLAGFRKHVMQVFNVFRGRSTKGLVAAINIFQFTNQEGHDYG